MWADTHHGKYTGLSDRVNTLILTAINLNAEKRVRTGPNLRVYTHWVCVRVDTHTHIYTQSNLSAINQINRWSLYKRLISRY